MHSRTRFYECARRVAVAVGLFFAASTAAQAQDTGRIQGVVYNSSGDLAIDAEVRLVAKGILTAVDEAAAFEFNDLRSGPHLLEALSPRWGRSILEVSVESGQTTDVTFEVLAHVGLDEVVVSAGPIEMTRSEAVRPADALSYQDLVDASAASLGESLKGKVGINSTYFGPGSSRPVIRGVGGNRVSILQQGLSNADASDIGPDHAPAVEALLAERIEFIRGPATLLYGSNAIGGVINVLDGRVPNEKPTSPITGVFTGRLNSVSLGRTGALKLRGTRGNIAWTLGGLSRATEEFKVPAGSIDGHEDHDENTIVNSNVTLNSGFGGLSYIESWGFVGAAVTLHGTKYGLPGHEDHDDDHDDGNGHEEEEEEEGVRVDMAKVSVDFEGLWRADREFLHGVRFRLGSSDYAHDELEHGDVGTTFDNDVVEGRLEIDHALSSGFHGVAGLQMDQRMLVLAGHEAFMPGSESNRFAAFLLERLDAGPFSLEGGLRYERASLTPDIGRERTFSGVSAGVGVNYQYSEMLTMALRSARNIKIPHPGELYANGHHVATQAFEIGNADLNVEMAFSLDASVHVHHERFEASASGFSNRYSDFIYLRHTQEREDGEAVFRVSQGEASFTGFEVEVEGELFHIGNQHAAVRIWSDYTRAHRTDSDEPLPRIPPMRIGGKLSYEVGALKLAVSMKSISAQKRVAQFETSTDGYMDLGASAQYKLFPGNTGHVISLQGRNLTNVIGRPHTSFLKDIVPLPGRDIRLTYRLLF